MTRTARPAGFLLLVAVFQLPEFLSCSGTGMRTLYSGPVTPPKDGERFDRRRWLKDAMPKKEDRCPGGSPGTDATGTGSVEHGDPEPCDVVSGDFGEGRPGLKYRLPAAWKRLDISHDSETWRLAFLDYSFVQVFTVSLFPTKWRVDRYLPTPPGNKIVPLEWQSNGTRIRVVYADDMIRVGLNGGGTALVSLHANTSSHVVGGIKLNSFVETTRFSIYEPCD